MRNSIKKVVILMLCIAIMFTYIVIPAIAEGSAIIHYTNDFNGYGIGGIWDAAAFPDSTMVSEGVSLSSEMLFASKTDAPGGPVNGDDRDAAEFVARSADGADKAFRFRKSLSGANAYAVGAKLYPDHLKLKKGESKVLHINFDMLAEDRVANKTFQIRRSTDKSFCEIVQFHTNGKIYVWGDNWCGYGINEWYNFDIYLDFDSNKVYLCENGKLVKAMDDSYFTGNEYFLDILQFVTNTSSATGMRIDNLLVSVANKSDVSLIIDAGVYKSHFLEPFSGFFDNNTIGSNVIKIDNSSSASVVSGMFGKRDSDKSMFAGSESPSAAATSAMTDILIGNSGFSSGDILHYSTLLAVGNDSPASKIIRLHASSNVDILTIDANGLYVYTKGTSLPKMRANQWYKYDFVIKTGSPNIMDVYVNGFKAASDILIPEVISSTSEITTRYVMTAGVADGYYIDDSSVTCYNADAQILNPEISATNSKADIKTDAIYVADDSYTVAEFVRDTASNVPFEVRTFDGYPASSASSVAGNNVVFRAKDGAEIYLPVYTENTVWFSNDFETDGGLFSLNGGASEIKSSGRGRLGNANYITVGSGAKARLESKPLMYFDSEKVTVESGVLAPDAIGNSAVLYLKEFDESSVRPIVTFAPDGKILFSNDNSYNSTSDSGLKWQPGLWYHIGATFNINEGGGTVYLNGRELGYLNVFSKGEYVHTVGFDVAGANAVAAIDNVKVYAGEYDYESDIVDPIVTTIRDLAIDDVKREIYIDSKNDSYLWNECVADGVKIYTDYTLDTQVDPDTDSIEIGNVVPVVSKDGKVAEYYVVKDISDSSIYIVKQNGEYISRGVVSSDNIDVKMFNATGVLIVAQYSGSELVKLDTSDTGAVEGLPLSGEAENVKLMFFETLDSAKPLTGARSLNISR